MSKSPPVPPASRSTKGPTVAHPHDEAEEKTDEMKDHKHDNSAEQGQTANIKQNTTNAGFFKGRRMK